MMIRVVQPVLQFLRDISHVSLISDQGGRKCMKKIGLLLLVSLLAITPVLAAAETYFSISQLKEQTEGYWEESFQTKWRDVDISTHIFLPEASALPVCMVAYDLDARNSPNSQLTVTQRNGKHFVDAGHVDKMRAKGENHAQQYYAPYENCGFSPGSSADLDTALTQAEQMLTECQFGSGLFDLALPQEVAVWWIENSRGEQVGQCEYMVSFRQLLHGVPILGHAFLGLPGSRREGKGGEPFGDTGGSFRYYDSGNYSFDCTILEETMRIADDMPLCGFDKIRETITQEITKGHIRCIYEIKLGYVLYNVKGATQEPGTGWRKDAAFYAVPTWFVSCIYVNQGKKAWSPSTDIEQAKRSDIYQAIVLIDAQTGKMLPQEKSKHRGAADYRGILTWEDVQK